MISYVCLLLLVVFVGRFGVRRVDGLSDVERDLRRLVWYGLVAVVVRRYPVPQLLRLEPCAAEELGHLRAQRMIRRDRECEGRASDGVRSLRPAEPSSHLGRDRGGDRAEVIEDGRLPTDVCAER